MIAVHLHKPKTPANVGSVMRAMACYGGSLLTICQRGGPEHKSGKLFKAATDTHASYKRFPSMLVDDLVVPFGFVPVAIELLDGAMDLPDFAHPRRAMYIFGPEDGTLGKSVTERCAHVVKIPMDLCMNLAATVNVVLYDRMVKERKP